MSTLQYTIFRCHFQLSSLCSGPSSQICPLYSIPSLGVKSTSSAISPKTCTLKLQLLHNTERPTKWSGSVLWSSANFYNIPPKICTPKLQLLHNTEQRSLDMERWLTTLENCYIWKTFYLGGNYVVQCCAATGA